MYKACENLKNSLGWRKTGEEITGLRMSPQIIMYIKNMGQFKRHVNIVIVYHHFLNKSSNWISDWK